jgi:hypothetical protein
MKGPVQIIIQMQHFVLCNYFSSCEILPVYRSHDPHSPDIPPDQVAQHVALQHSAHSSTSGKFFKTFISRILGTSSSSWDPTSGCFKYASACESHNWRDEIDRSRKGKLLRNDAHFALGFGKDE